MTEKIYDIKPPKNSLLEKTPSKTEKLRKPKPKKQKKIFIFISLIIIIGLFVFLSKNSKAEIRISPKIENFEKTFDILATKDIKVNDIKNKKIKAIFLEKEKELWEEFQSSDITTLETKAQGLIRVYNKSSKPLSLIKETRFLSENGKTFLTKKPVYIPGNSYSDVEVVAEKSGKEYNIDPCHFSIPGLKGSPRYATTWGQSFKKMSGGKIEKVRKVSKKDIENGKKKIINDLSSQLEKEIKENNQDFVFKNNNQKIEILDFFSPVKEGAKINNFSLSAKAKIEVLTFKKSDLENLVKQIILDDLKKSDSLLKSFKIDFELKDVDFINKSLKIKTKVLVKTYKKINNDLLKDKISGKRIEVAKDIIFKKFPQIDKANIKIIPTWIKKIPTNKGKIIIFID